jgi:chromosome segregation ATPase
MSSKDVSRMSQSSQEGLQTGVSKFFDKVKEHLFEDDANPPTNSVPAGLQKLETVVKQQAPHLEDKQMVDKLMQIVMGKTTAYTALIEALTPLENYISDEKSRYKAAYAIVGKSRTIDQIIQAIDLQHFQSVEDEIQRFKAQIQTREQLNVSKHVKEVEVLREQIQAANNEILVLRKQIDQKISDLKTEVETKNHKIVAIEQEVENQRTSITLVNHQFNNAINLVKHNLTQAKEKISLYLNS